MIDCRITNDSLNLEKFKKFLLKENCVDEVRQKCGLMKSDILIGYWKRNEKTQQYHDIKECWSNAGLQLALKTVTKSPEIYSIVGKTLHFV